MLITRTVVRLALILVVQFPLASFSQEPAGASATAGQEQIVRRRPETVRLLEHARRLSDDARGMKSIDEIPLLTRLADTVWPSDSSLGERLLARSFELTLALLKAPKADADSVETDPQALFAAIDSIASRHNPALEKKLRDRWQESIASVEKRDLSKSDPSHLAYLLLNQSVSFLQTDEPKARQLFRQSATLRVTQDHYFLLLNHRKRAPDMADTWFSDTLEVLAQRPLADANELLVLSAYLFSPDGGIAYVIISGYNAANVAANLSATAKHPMLAKRYLGLLLAKANPNEPIPPAVAYFALKNLLPQFQIYAPELLNDVYAKTATLLPNVSKDDSSTFTDAHKDFNASESDKVSDWTRRLETADKFDREDRRDLEYLDILFGFLLPQKDFAKAALVVNRISNQELKEKSRDLVNLAALQTKLAASEKDSSVSDSDCNQIKNPLVRVIALSNLGQARLKQKATGEFLRLLTQAVGDANQIKDTQDRIQAKLMLAHLSLEIDSAVGLERAVGALKEVNQFADFSMNRSEFSLKVSVYGLKNELPITSPAPSSLASAVAKMCRVNCEETFQLTNLLEKKEVRLWANLVAVRTGLRENLSELRVGSR